jgi:hypothetical protein
MVELMRESWQKKQPIDLRSTGRWTMNSELILKATTPAGEVAEITLDEYARAKGEFMRELSANPLDKKPSTSEGGNTSSRTIAEAAPPHQ